MARWEESDTVPLSDDGGNTYTLPTFVHVDEDVFDRERSTIFADSWQYAGSRRAISSSGDYFTAEIAGRPVLVIRAEDGSIRAFYNVCPHRGSRMLDGTGRTERIMCPYHNWTFDTNGEFCTAPKAFSTAVRNPDLDDAAVDGPDSCENSLHSLAVDTLGPFVFVNVASDPTPFDELVGRIPGELADRGVGALRLAQRRETDLECNWKIMVSNYLECDHCHSNHPDFVRAVDMDEYTVEVGEYHSTQYGPITDDEGSVVGESRFYFLWPNTTINIYEEGRGCAVYRIDPRGPETTRLTAHYYFEDDELTDERSEIVERSLQLQREDFELVERQHEGVRSGALQQGRFGPNEHAVHHFHELVEDQLDLR
ncbi:aromatic ring-hydroxylating dioxygenase subunit alpha [Halosolutus amylolyticus]|uniref:Aromatic ring-hydroxylating dioxygenase subunit alpha n=1 Tax=Halosolutus amylolyticus TaxID=2932267 RepID=A0ABD5PJ30_9EURY|nr:SRPBCC family protein [Halosolutus amylolyticus]